MTRGLRVVAVVAALLGASASAGAAPILEVEGNNTIATAQGIPSSAFTTPVPATVFDPPGYPTATVSGLGAGGTNDVDFYAFNANGGNAYFDIDDNPTTFDTILALFDSSGTLIAINDDSFPADLPGSLSSGDSFLGVLMLGPGTYYLAVSAFPNNPNAAVVAGIASTLIRPDGAFGGRVLTGSPAGDSSYLQGPVSSNGTVPYTLHISLQSPAVQPVPEPATMLLFGAGLSAIGARLRRRR
jgi:hypothetical protein